MRRICIIGLGNFGFHVATTLYDLGHEVVAIDMDQEKVQRVHGHCSYAMVGDAANKDFLKQQGVDEMDAAVVSTGERSHLSTLITLYLKELKVPQILVKAISEDHGRILERVGADEVIYPEKDMAIKTARSIASPNVLEFIPLLEDYSINESAPPRAFIGKTLAQLNLRNKFGITVIAIKDVLTDEVNVNPAPDRVIRDSDLLVLLGRTTDIDRACKDT